MVQTLIKLISCGLFCVKLIEPDILFHKDMINSSEFYISGEEEAEILSSSKWHAEDKFQISTQNWGCHLGELFR